MRIKILLLSGVISSALLFSACNKDSLNIVNPNAPTFATLNVEEGIKRYAAGVYSKFGLEFWWLAMANHDIMGDSYYIPWGNFSWRWVNQPTSMTLSTGTVLTPPQEGEQKLSLQLRNTRAETTNNAFWHEWRAMYFVNNQANGILANIDKVDFGANADTKKRTLKAWAYWWKGFAYSRIGSMYISGLINSEADKFTSQFVKWEDIVAEGDKNFDLAIAELTAIGTANTTYTDYMKILIPDFTQIGSGGVLNPDVWIRQINTYKARNIMANKKVTAMTAADWTRLKTLVDNGIRPTDKIFTMRSAQDNDLVSQTGWAPARFGLGWFFPSERWVQDFKAGDQRFTRNLFLRGSDIRVNQSGRGFQYGTRYDLSDISAGGNWASSVIGAAEQPIACSYEENELMLAEFKIRNGDIPGGVAHINNVRTFQNAGLAPILPVVSLAEALEELRRERRVGLFLKGVSFYDARRWGVIDPPSEGGGRAKGVVVLAGGAIDSAFINYNYMKRWDVPLNELDFNTPSAGSAAVKTN